MFFFCCVFPAKYITQPALPHLAGWRRRRRWLGLFLGLWPKGPVGKLRTDAMPWAMPSMPSCFAKRTQIESQSFDCDL